MVNISGINSKVTPELSLAPNRLSLRTHGPHFNDEKQWLRSPQC